MPASTLPNVECTGVSPRFEHPHQEFCRPIAAFLSIRLLNIDPVKDVRLLVERPTNASLQAGWGSFFVDNPSS